MPMIRDGIENVRGMVLPDGIADDGHSVGFSRAALVSWHSGLEGKLHQVYVNDRFAGATLDPAQRQLVVQLPSSFEAAVRLEVTAVEPEEAHVDFADALGFTPIDSTRVRLTLLRNQDLPLGATANVYCDHGTGQIDYEAPLNREPVPLWPCRQDKAGFGMAQFATGDFGYESAAAVGFGQGSFGHGQFGLDADTVDWVSPDLSLGTYRFGVSVTDLHGDESAASETEPITVVPPARPAAGCEIVTFDPANNQLTLSVADQP
ncbi:MAG: hypothetical protein JW993_02135 [Sedimentisphaerales bacterium]|nr:hypothetical protein [Sedimentisphaerales bacterium]